MTAVLLFLGGLALLVAGGELLVSGAVDIARLAGMTERVIGLTVVAAGTGMPEVVTSAVAAARRPLGRGCAGRRVRRVPLDPGGVMRVRASCLFTPDTDTATERAER